MSDVEVTVKKTVNQLYNYSTVLGAAIRYKPYSEITVEMETQLKTVKITSNIFAVQPKFSDFFDLCLHWVSVVHNFHHSFVFFYNNFAFQT